MKRLLKKNQVIIYVIAIMLMTAGYLNYMTNQDDISVETSLQMEASDDSKLADIGDATLVSSNDIVGEDTTDTNTTNTNTDQETTPQKTPINQTTTALSKKATPKQKIKRAKNEKAKTFKENPLDSTCNNNCRHSDIRVCSKE